MKKPSIHICDVPLVFVTFNGNLALEQSFLSRIMIYARSVAITVVYVQTKNSNSAFIQTEHSHDVVPTVFVEKLHNPCAGMSYQLRHNYIPVSPCAVLAGVRYHNYSISVAATNLWNPLPNTFQKIFKNKSNYRSLFIIKK